MDVSQKQSDNFAAACRMTADLGLLRCSSGNMSWRVGDDLMLVSATRKWLGDLTADDISHVRISDGKVLNNSLPSTESLFHRGILKKRRDANVVLHFQSPAATTLACGNPENVNFNVFVEVPYYIGDVGIVPPAEPGSQELADAVIDISAKHDMIILKNHGLVAIGKDLNETIQKAAFFELACDVILRGGNNTVPITPELVDRIKQSAANKAV
ncbi:MAG: class II aldolase/adducin family protein [Phycisphaerae bacterium]|nr:class II aldolase/adducin family protein [Phycisphaerae bacterium]